MNPPYLRNLHLKFLEKVIEVTDKVVTVQPVRWIEETVGPKKKTSAFNKYEDSIAKHIKELDIYSAEEAEKLFEKSEKDAVERLNTYKKNDKGKGLFTSKNQINIAIESRFFKESHWL